MRTESEMIALNRVQAEFYDKVHEAEQSFDGSGGYKKNKAANLMTRIWASMRNAQYHAVTSAGIRERERAVHLAWAAEKSGGDFLEIGCQHGSIYTFDLIRASGRYTGVELSAASADALRRKIDEQGLAHKAEVICGDFLEFQSDRRFDFVYANGVLHHFENPTPVFSRIRQLIANDGLLMFVEPVAINKLYRFLRSLYRPFQSDAAWEWPFRENTVRQLSKYFRVSDGLGWGRMSSPVAVLCGLPVIGRAAFPIYRMLVRREVTTSEERKFWQNSTVVAKCSPI